MFQIKEVHSNFSPLKIGCSQKKFSGEKSKYSFIWYKPSSKSVLKTLDNILTLQSILFRYKFMPHIYCQKCSNVFYSAIISVHITTCDECLTEEQEKWRKDKTHTFNALGVTDIFPLEIWDEEDDILIC